MATVSLGITTASTANATSYVSGSFTPAAGDLLVVLVTGTGTVATTTGGGTLTDTQSLGWSRLVGTAYNGTTDTMAAFVANKLTTATAMTVTWDCTGDAATGAIIHVHRIAGAEGTYVRQFGTGTFAAAGTPSVVLPNACLTGNPVVGMAANAGAINTLTQPTGFTEFTETAYTTPASNMEPIYANSGITASTITWGATSATAGGAIIIELYNAGTGPQPTDSSYGYYGSISAV